MGCGDITYIPMSRGFVYLVAVMGWYSRKVLSHRVSNTMVSDFCVDALEEALSRYGCPEIFNTDQGSQFTSEAFTGVLLGKCIFVGIGVHFYRNKQHSRAKTFPSPRETVTDKSLSFRKYGSGSLT